MKEEHIVQHSHASDSEELDDWTRYFRERPGYCRKAEGEAGEVEAPLPPLERQGRDVRNTLVFPDGPN